MITSSFDPRRRVLRRGLDLGKLHYEAQVSERDGQFYLVITLTRDSSTWTSKPGLLEGAASWEQAHEQAIEQVTALHRALRNE